MAFAGLIAISCSSIKMTEVPIGHVAFAADKWCAGAAPSETMESIGDTPVSLLKLNALSDPRFQRLLGAAAIYQVGVLNPSLTYDWKGMLVVEGKPVFVESDAEVVVLLASRLQRMDELSLADVMAIAQLFGHLRGYTFFEDKAVPPGGLQPHDAEFLVRKTNDQWNVECTYFTSEGGLSQYLYSFAVCGGSIQYSRKKLVDISYAR